MDIFLQDLIRLDKLNERETIFFSGMNSNMAMLLYILIMKRYKNDCYLHLDIPSFVHEYGSFFSRHTNINNLANQLINCINNNIHTIIIPYTLSSPYMFNSHANMLIYKVIENVHQIDHFEPHGEKVSNEKLYLQQSKVFQSQIVTLQQIIKHYYQTKNKNIEQIYNTSFDICPTQYGLQYKHEQFYYNNNSGMFELTSHSGLCGYWSFFLAELVLKFPNLQTSVITEELLKYSSDDLNHIIRGYIFYNNDALLKLYKHFSKKSIRTLITLYTPDQILYERLHSYIYKKYLKNSILSVILDRFRHGGKKCTNKHLKEKRTNKHLKRKTHKKHLLKKM